MTAITSSADRGGPDATGMVKPLLRQLLTLRTVPTPVVAAGVLTSYVTLLVSRFVGWPLWAQVLVVLLPWAPILGSQTAWVFSHYRWLALFYVLVVTQSGHVLEHLSQVTQIHVLHRHGAEARGIFGALDIEWVHFGWNTWVLIALVLLVFRYRGNPWLWVSLVIAGWHQVEHTYILSTYLRTGKAGTPGLLAAGGDIAGGLSLQRPDLHFFYNLLETAPILGAFLLQVRRCYATEVASAGTGSHTPSRSEQTVPESSTQSHIPRGETMPEIQLDPRASANVAPPGAPASSRRRSRRLLVAIVGLGAIGLATLVAIGPKGGETQPAATTLTPTGYSKYLIFMADSTLGAPEEMMLSGDVFQREVMGRTEQQVAENKAQAKAFFRERFGLDFSQGDSTNGASLMGFTLGPKVNYRAYTIAGQSVPESGWEVRDGGWVVMIGPGGTTLYGTYGGPSGKPVPEGAMIPFGEYSVKPIGSDGKSAGDSIVLQYQGFGPMVFAADGTSLIECELVSPQLGRGTALGYMKMAPLPTGGVGMTVRNVLTFPAR